MLATPVAYSLLTVGSFYAVMNGKNQECRTKSFDDIVQIKKIFSSEWFLYDKFISNGKLAFFVDRKRISNCALLCLTLF